MNLWDAPRRTLHAPMIFVIKSNLSFPAGPKIVSGSRYLAGLGMPRPAHEATTRVPFGAYGPAAGSRNIPPRWLAAPEALQVGCLFGKEPSRLNAADLWINGSVHHFIVTARTPVGPSGARLGHR
jgi:hypothetical protein